MPFPKPFSKAEKKKKKKGGSKPMPSKKPARPAGGMSVGY